MPKKFNALVIDNKNENFVREIKELDTESLKDGNVLVKIDYSSLNYKDALILNNGGRIVKKYPFVPGIDFSGTVEDSQDQKFKKNDKVILTGFRVGEAYFGGFSQYAKVNSEFLVKLPNTLTTLKAMMMGTAGLTALLCAFAVKAKEELLMGTKVKDVLVTGATGGVGSFAVMALNKMGYDVHAVTGKKDKHEYLKKLGAKNILDRKDFLGESKLLEKGLWDCVVDTVGGEALTKILVQTKPGGIVALPGNAGGNKISTNVMPFVVRGVKLWGIDSSGTSAKRKEFVWNEAAKLIDFSLIDDSIKEVSLKELISVFPEILKGGLAGRIVVNPNK
jgi:acrylyl-CoA reductase (NADPH)